jgi:hypothetical protein
MRSPRRFSVFVITACFAALAAVGHPQPASATPAQTATVVVHVRPVDTAGHLRHGYRVSHRFGKASCQFGSEATGTAYRCFAANYVIDPCWVTANRHYVDCLTEGWSHRVWRLHVTKGYDNEGFSSGARTAATPGEYRRSPVIAAAGSREPPGPSASTESTTGATRRSTPCSSEGSSERRRYGPSAKPVTPVTTTTRATVTAPWPKAGTASQAAKDNRSGVQTTSLAGTAPTRVP